MPVDQPMLLTIGHSTHAWEDFLWLLRQHGVAAVADVRSHPYSRRLEQFNRDQIEPELKAAGIGYEFLGKELGARRDEPECYRDDRASYERIAQLPNFLRGIARLRQAAAARRVALMCAEKEPLDCHRTVLICRSVRDEFHIEHILADGTTEEHAACERRLVRLMGVGRTLFEPDLTDEELIQRAYDERAAEIAYRASQEGAPP